MSDENATIDKGENSGRDRAGGHDLSRDVETTTVDAPALLTTNGHLSVNGDGPRHSGNGKSDSEAETVVLSGKEEGQATARRKTIKHEDVSDDQRTVGSIVRNAKPRNEDDAHRHESNGARRPSLKRKRVAHGVMVNEGVECGNSSNLSSAYSSPAPQATPDQNHGPDSDRSRSSPPVDEDIRKKKGRLRKRKLKNIDEEEGRKRRGKSDPSSEIVNGKERREPKRARKQHTSSVHSESPPPHQHLRTHSTQTGSIHNGVKRKKPPPSLSVDSRRKPSEESGADSDDSSSQKSRPRLHKSASIDEPMTSKQSHKKILDRSGRTAVARACANDNLEQLALALKERPQHLNEPDYARNTPLQIAAIEGFVDPVRYLIDEGCVIDCKNIDGDTPLIDAVENGHLQVVDLLLEAGADPRLRNGTGFEPLDLVNDENDDYEAIRGSLIASKEKQSLRRPSEDQSTGAKDNDTASLSAPGGSPTDSWQTQGSKPGSGGGETLAKAYTGKWELDGGRRKTARREPTREDLLWITSTPAKLRDAASKGDMAIVGHCLNTLKADTESMLAAARGGHDDVLEILIAIGKPPEPDPEPLVSSEYKPEYNTPMLAAIGGGNVKVIKLLLGQPKFNPTRRMYRGYTYYELAKQRQSSNWQEEYDVLKEAYDNYDSEGGRKSTSSSPHKVRTKRPKPSFSPPVSTSSERPVERIKREPSHKSSSNKHLHPSDSQHKGSSSAISDRDAEGGNPRKLSVRNGRSVSDAGSTASFKPEPGAKPRRRLLSKNEIQSDHDTKRKVSPAADKSPPSSNGNQRRLSTDPPVPGTYDKIHSSQDSFSNREGSKKRPRTSTSPHAGLSELNKSRDIVKKKKRQRADSQGKVVEPDRKDSLPRGPAMVANMIASPEPVTSPIKIPGTAPVAFMGGSTASPPLVRSPVEQRRSVNFPVGGLGPAIQQDVTAPANTSSRHDAPIRQAPGQPHERPLPTTEGGKSSGQSFPVTLQTERDFPAMAEEHSISEKAARDLEALMARGREARAAHEKEEAQIKAQLEEAELQRQMQIEREEAEARAAKKRNDELQMQRRADQERQQKEKEERRRAELELREEQRRARIQEEQELQRRERLPYGMQKAAELGPDEARDPAWIQNWLPLYYVTSEDLDPDCNQEESQERWITNLQVAPLLANRDLELSQCESYPHRLLLTLLISPQT